MEERNKTNGDRKEIFCDAVHGEIFGLGSGKMKLQCRNSLMQQLNMLHIKFRKFFASNFFVLGKFYTER
jgi:hypothetical protein